MGLSRRTVYRWRRRQGDLRDRSSRPHHSPRRTASRLVYAELRSGLGTADCTAFLAGAIAFFDARGIRVRRVLTDNGAGYRSSFTTAAAALGLRHTRTRPRHPWTNGRVEAFNGTI